MKYEDWCARKEYDGKEPYLRLFIELKEDGDIRELEKQMELRLRAVDVDYRDLEGWLGQERTVRVTTLSRGTFGRYYDEKVKAGAPLAQVKPPHINPSEDAVTRLLQLSGSGSGGDEPGR